MLTKLKTNHKSLIKKIKDKPLPRWMEMKEQKEEEECRSKDHCYEEWKMGNSIGPSDGNILIHNFTRIERFLEKYNVLEVS